MSVSFMLKAMEKIKDGKTFIVNAATHFGIFRGEAMKFPLAFSLLTQPGERRRKNVEKKKKNSFIHSCPVPELLFILVPKLLLLFSLPQFLSPFSTFPASFFYYLQIYPISSSPALPLKCGRKLFCTVL